MQVHAFGAQLERWFQGSLGYVARGYTARPRAQSGEETGADLERHGVHTDKEIDRQNHGRALYFPSLLVF